MSEASEAVISRIRKLMAYANDSSASEGEIENALGHARKLMEKFNLDENAILLEEGPHQSSYEEIKTHDIYSRANGIDRFDMQLARVPCFICEVKFYRDRRYVKDEKTGKWGDREFIVMYGLPKDVAIASAMYHELLATMRAMVRFRFGDNWKKEFSSYCSGFVDRLEARARELRKKPADISPQESTAIVLAKDALLERFARENLSLTRGKARSRNISSAGAYDAGHQDGNNVDLGLRGIKGGKPKQLS